jgi:hypothetical protein
MAVEMVVVHEEERFETQSQNFRILWLSTSMPVSSHQGELATDVHGTPSQAQGEVG